MMAHLPRALVAAACSLATLAGLGLWGSVPASRALGQAPQVPERPLVPPHADGGPSVVPAAPPPRGTGRIDVEVQRPIRSPSGSITLPEDTIARWLIAESDTVIALMQLGDEHGEQSQVRRFANRVSRSQQRFRDDLQALIPDQPVRPAVVARSKPIVAAEPPAIDQDRAEVIRTNPVERTKTGAAGSGQETGLTGTRSRDVASGETGANRVVGGGDRLPRNRSAVTKRTEAGGGFQKSVTEEMRARDRRLDALDRAGQAPAAKLAEQTENHRSDGPAGNSERVRVAADEAEEVVESAPSHDFAMIGRQLADHRLSVIEQELHDLPAADFDRAFLRHVVHVHVDLLAMLRLMADYASPRLEALTQSAEEDHLDRLYRAKRMLQALDE